MPIFNHGKNTRVLYSNPSWQGTDIWTTWDATTQTITIVSANAPVYAGMGIASSAFESTILSVSSNVAGATVTIVDSFVGTETTPQVTQLYGVGYSGYYMSYRNGYTADLSQYFNDVSISRAVDPTETTTFRIGGSKSYIPGLASGTISLSGMYEGTVNGTDAFFSGVLANQNTSPADYQYQLPAVVVFPAGETTSYSGEIPTYLGADYRCQLASGVNTKYDLKSPVAGVVAADMELQASGGVWNGIGQYISLSTTGYASYTAYTNGYDGKSPSNKGGLLVMGLVVKGDMPALSTFTALSAPALPLTITTGDNDIVQYVHLGTATNFTLAAGTYATFTDAQNALASATSNANPSQTFTQYLASIGGYVVSYSGFALSVVVEGNFPNDYIDASGAIALGFNNPTYPYVSSTSPFFVLQFQDSADGTTWTDRDEYLIAPFATVNTTGVFEITGTIQRYTQLKVVAQGTNVALEGYYGFARY